MSNNRKKWLWIASTGLCFAAVLIVRTMGDYDYRLVASGAKPRFPLSSGGLADGGSIDYHGVGYRVTAMNRMMFMTSTGMLRRVGPELSFWVNVPGVLPYRDGTIQRVNGREGLE